MSDIVGNLEDRFSRDAALYRISEHGDLFFFIHTFPGCENNSFLTRIRNTCIQTAQTMITSPCSGMGLHARYMYVYPTTGPLGLYWLRSYVFVYIKTNDKYKGFIYIIVQYKTREV